MHYAKPLYSKEEVNTKSKHKQVQNRWKTLADDEEDKERCTEIYNQIIVKKKNKYYNIASMNANDVSMKELANAVDEWKVRDAEVLLNHKKKELEVMIDKDI